MPPPDQGDITPGELSRRMQDVLSSFKSMVQQIEERYVRLDVLGLVKEGFAAQMSSIKSALEAVERDMVDKASYNALEKRVSELEDSNKWLFRLVVGFIILAVLGAVFTASNFGGGGGG